ncbi:MAG: hypothetical protein ACREPR_23355 [Brasilonema sp.]
MAIVRCVMMLAIVGELGCGIGSPGDWKPWRLEVAATQTKPACAG